MGLAAMMVAGVGEHRLTTRGGGGAGGGAGAAAAKGLQERRHATESLALGLN